MRTLKALGLVSAGTIVAFAQACGPTSSTCKELHNCESRGGASGNDGKSGASGDAPGGSGNSGGTSGTSGISGNGGSPGGSGSSGEAGTAGAGPTCDPTKSPSEEACLVNDDYAIFVAPTGKDGGGGSKAGPVKTIAKALELASQEKIVIACDGTYEEQVKIAAGAKLYGGFACPGTANPWVYEAGKKAKVAPAAKGVALSITAAATAVAIEDFEFDAKDGLDPGESSIAAFVSGSTAVTLTRVKLVAGTGVNGSNGALAPLTLPDPLTLKGNPASGDTGGAFNTGMCSVGEKPRGGAGGYGGAGAVTTGGSGTPDLGMGKGGVAGSCSPNGTGQDGANAAPQPPALGATKLGSITPTGWTGAPGADGATGTPGQGGGGGAGALAGGGGGGGGSGGCGGAGATGGKAGGSSIALLALNSSLTLTANELISATAGSGGNGIAGQEGQLGGNGGLPDANGGCGGGKGGKGGQGGAGGGAAGGISVGIAYQGTAPVADADTTVVTGIAGTKGVGGAPGMNDGIDGVKQDVLQVL
ncbi:MAG TPA: hypothetical protein VFK05_29485 [Polyangiaceae bacterium]|nr:hypothetical protein [Polyangiaceae bacterium]